MSIIDNSVFYVLIPFQYKGKKSIEQYIERIGKTGDLIFHKKEINDEFFLGYINETYKRCSAYEIERNEKALSRNEDFLNKNEKPLNNKEESLNIELYCFDTNMGFFVSKLDYDNREYNKFTVMLEETQRFANSLSEYSHAGFMMLVEKMGEISVFPAGGKKKCLILSNAISKISAAELGELKNDNTDVYKIDKLHECYISSDHFCFVTNQYFSNIDNEEERKAEENFRKKYEENFLKVFLILHHERQMYLILRKQIVNQKSSNNAAIRKTKKQIIDLLTCFSYKIVTEDKEFQSVYNEYRNTLGLAEYESTLSDLVFKLDDEIDKGRDKKINFVSLLIGILGLLQLVTVITDIINYFTN